MYKTRPMSRARMHRRIHANCASIAPSARKFTLGYNPGGDVNLFTDAAGHRISITTFNSNGVGQGEPPCR